MNNKMTMTIASKLGGSAKVLFHKLRRNKPEAAAILGGLAVLAGTVLACSKTKEAVDGWEGYKQELEDVRENTNEKSPERIEEYLRCTGRFAVKMGKLYGVAAGLWIGGMAAIGKGHLDLKRENASLILDSVAFKKMFDEYRKAMQEEIGEDREKEIYFGCREEEIDVIEVNPETGTKKIVRKKGAVLDKGRYGSKFARNFSASTSWAFSDHGYGDFILEARIQNLNAKLKCVPFITMNEVYDELQMKNGYGKCKDGLNWGWVWNPDNPNGPNEIIVERLAGWEEIHDERENKTYYVPCLRIDFNCQYLDPLI